TVTTPAEEIRTAAEKLRELLAAPGLTPGPWLSLDHGDRLLYDGPGAEDQPPVYVVDEPMSNGANADWIEAMHPGVGNLLAKWLDSWGVIDLSEHAAMQEDARHALAIARAINGSPS
ncbi:hypothetical protein ADK57_16035, partial [Streptomyces sp. MMG1533]|uniref:hypothetical protein n=1 Tax=Streptomyces sp. MMG1533 TaxID=1415546 RepID=UPI0006C1AE53